MLQPSRLPLAAAPSPDGSIAPANSDDCDPEYVALLTTASHTLSATDLNSACATCPELTKLCSQITRGWPPSPKGLDPNLLLYYKLRLELSVKEPFVFRGSRLIVPIALRPDLIGWYGQSNDDLNSTGGQRWMLRCSMPSAPFSCAS